LLLRFVCEN